MTEQEHVLLEIEGVGHAILEKLLAVGIDSPEKLSVATLDQLIGAGIPKASAVGLASAAIKHMEEGPDVNEELREQAEIDKKEAEEEEEPQEAEELPAKPTGVTQKVEPGKFFAGSTKEVYAERRRRNRDPRVWRGSRQPAGEKEAGEE